MTTPLRQTDQEGYGKERNSPTLGEFLRVLSSEGCTNSQLLFHVLKELNKSSGVRRKLDEERIRQSFKKLKKETLVRICSNLKIHDFADTSKSDTNDLLNQIKDELKSKLSVVYASLTGTSVIIDEPENFEMSKVIVSKYKPPTPKPDSNLEELFENAFPSPQTPVALSRTLSKSREASEIDTIGIQLLQEGKIKEFNDLREKNPQWKPDLSRTDLSKHPLSGVNLSGAKLIGVIFGNGQKTENADFSNADLSHAVMKGWKNKDCDFSGSNMTMAKTDDSTFFSLANLDGADMSQIWYPNGIMMPMFGGSSREQKLTIHQTKLTKELYKYIREMCPRIEGIPTIVSAEELAKSSRVQIRPVSPAQAKSISVTTTTVSTATQIPSPANSSNTTATNNAQHSVAPPVTSPAAQPKIRTAEPMAKSAPKQTPPKRIARVPKQEKKGVPRLQDVEDAFEYDKLTVLSIIPDIIGLEKSYTEPLSPKKEVALQLAKDRAIKEHRQSTFAGEELIEVIDASILRYQRNQLIALGLYEEPLNLKYPEYWDHQRKKFEIDMAFHHLSRILKYRGELDQLQRYKKIYDKAVKALANAEAEKTKSEDPETLSPDWMTDEAVSGLEASHGVYQEEREESYRDKKV